MPRQARPNGCMTQNLPERPRHARQSRLAAPRCCLLAQRRRRRIVMLTAFAQMIALDAKTGNPVPVIRQGRPDRSHGRPAPAGRRNYYTMPRRRSSCAASSWSAPRCSTGGARPSPPGDVRGFDIATGESSGPSTPWRRARRQARDLGERFLEGDRQHRRLGADQRRRSSARSTCR